MEGNSNARKTQLFEDKKIRTVLDKDAEEMQAPDGKIRLTDCPDTS